MTSWRIVRRNGNAFAIRCRIEQMSAFTGDGGTDVEVVEVVEVEEVELEEDVDRGTVVDVDEVLVTTLLDVELDVLLGLVVEVVDDELLELVGVVVDDVDDEDELVGVVVDVEDVDDEDELVGVVVDVVDDCTAVTPAVTWPMNRSPWRMLVGSATMLLFMSSMAPKYSCAAVTVSEPSEFVVCSLKTIT
jgi:hypothetical protein